MLEDYTIFLWLLKLGAVTNIYFLLTMPGLGVGGTHAHLIFPAQILFCVSAYRCLFPVRYEDNIVFHAVFSSVFATRLLATFAEVAFIYLLSHVVRRLNVNQIGWVAGLSWLMVVQIIICQGFVWIAVLTDWWEFYFYEEFGWVLICAASAIASAYLYVTVDTLGHERVLLQLNLLFGAVYLPWQVFNLRAIRANARRNYERSRAGAQSFSQRLAAGLTRSIRVKNPRRDAAAWGGLIGLSWMTGYWATLIPMWVYYIVGVLATN
ncbi:MAG TPA: hypothetical protein VMW17_12605 [Candidatus Binatia bacterium]|nr:hypothetical protein [Candidatus Binatia bacterium]